MNVWDVTFIAPTDGIDFMRDIIALMCVVSGIIAVAFDGKVPYQSRCFFGVVMVRFDVQVYLLEVCLFPLFYIIYIALVIGMGYFRVSSFNHHDKTTSQNVPCRRPGGRESQMVMTPLMVTPATSLTPLRGARPLQS